MLASDVEEFIQHGADAVLGKPLKLAMLKQAIQTHVQGLGATTKMISAP